MRPELVRGRWPFMLAMVFAMLPFGAGPQGAAEGSGLRQVALVALFLSATFAIARFPGRFRLIPRAVPLSFALLLLYVMVSPLWSPDPYVSFKRAIQVLGVAIIGIALVVGGNGNTRLHRLAAPTLLVGMVLAIVFAAAFPGFAFADNGLRAYMLNKNTFGQFSVLCTACAVGAMVIGGRVRWFWLALAIAGLAGLVLSRSATAMVSLAALAAYVAFATAARRLHPSWRHAFLGLVLVLGALAFVLGLVYGFPSFERVATTGASVTGRDITLSGRTYLWGLIWDQAMRHPWFGTGYGGFWLGLEGVSGQIAFKVKWGYPGQAHNGFLDLFNELGIVGLMLVIAFLFAHARNLSRLSQTDPRLAAFHVALFVLVVILNFAEATLLRTTHLWWIVFVASAFEVALLASPERASRATQPSTFPQTAVP